MNDFEKAYRSEVENALFQLNHTSMNSEKASDMLFEAYVTDINNGNCPHLDELYERKIYSFVSQEERNVLTRVYEYYFGGNGDNMKDITETIKEKIKTVYERLGNKEEESEKDRLEEKGKDDGLKEIPPEEIGLEESEEDSKELPEENPKDKNNDLNEEASDRAELSALKEKNEDLENRLRLAREELERLSKNSQKALKEAEDTVNRYQKMIREFDKEREGQEKAYRDRLEQKRIETEAQIAAYDNDMRKKIRAEAEKERERLLKESLSDYLDEMRSDWRISHAELSDISEEMAINISRAKAEACDESSRMQREMKEAMDKYKRFLDDYTVQLCSGLDNWRSSVFSIQLKSFAEWFSRFCGFVDRFDSRFIKELGNDEAETIIKIGTSLNNLRNALERALPSMGLKSYYPMTGDEYDPVYHEANEDFVEIGALVSGCTKPGVEFVSANDELRRVLIKAEVNVG